MKRKILLIIAFFFLFSSLSSKEVRAQACTHPTGCFDCQWRSVAGRNACRAVNDNCISRDFEPNTTLCAQLTPLGRDECERAQYQRLACVEQGTGSKPVNLDMVCGTKDREGIDTAIGCIPFRDLTEFSKFLLGWGLGIGGGIAFILIVVAGFQIITSSGDPKRLQAGKELLTSAIAGVLLIIFSAFILRFIGIDLLDIPGFGTR